jgi:hypothetical protein
MSVQATLLIRRASRNHQAACHILAAPCIRDRAARYVDADGEVDWLRLEQAAGLWPEDEWLLVRAALDLDTGQEPTGLKRLCSTLHAADLRRVLEAIGTLRPEVAHAWRSGR